MQLAVSINDEKISFVYKFAYYLCGSRKVAEKLTELAITAHYKQGWDDKLLLKCVWQEYTKYYEFMELREGSDVKGLLLSLPANLRCGVILRDIFKYEYKQIAYVLSLTPKDVEKIVAQGRQKIKQLLKKITISEKIG